MDLDTIKERLRYLDSRISDVNAQINTISEDLEDAQAAQQSAKKLQTEFESFVSRRKQARDRNLFENGLRSFQSFLSKAKRMLMGEDYWRANSQVEEMLHVTNQEINRLGEDLSFCKRELWALTAEKDDLMAEYKVLMAEIEGGADT